jgi:serine/threonine protein phosphatase 1
MKPAGRNFAEEGCAIIVRSSKHHILARNHLFATHDKRRPSVPEGTRVYAIGDVHGRLDLLNDLLLRIDADVAASPGVNAIEVFVGDYVDRGKSSRQVLDRLIERTSSGRAVCLTGNHEKLLLEFLETPSILTKWLKWGALETLMSYGIVPAGDLNLAKCHELAEQFRNELPESHLSFLKGLRSSFSVGDFFFVHAGIRPNVGLSSQSEEDLTWIRDEFLLSDQNFGKIIVHGHTPTPEPQVYRNRIGIDTGAYATGKLTCVVIEGEDFSFL